MSPRTPYSDGVLNRPKPSPLDIDGLLAFHRSTFGDARMDANSDAAAAQAAADAKTATEAADKRFTQADMNATVARETAAAKAKAESDLAAALGCSVDEAKQIIADRKASDDAKKTEAERAAEAAKTAQSDAERIKTEAATDRHHARLERALGRGGLDIENAVMLRAGLAALDVPLDAGDDAVKAAVDALKKDAAQLFTAGGNGGGGGHSDSGGQRRDTQAPAGEFGGKGKAEADRRFAAERERLKQTV